MSGLDPIPEENLAWDYYYRLYYDDDEDEFVPPENQNYIYTTPMAEGRYDPMDETTEKTPLIPGDEDDDDDTNPLDNLDLSQIPVTEEPTPGDTDSTQPFEPGSASTPAGEQIQMTTRTRLPQESGPRTAETSFIEGDARQNLRNAMAGDAWKDVKKEFENADATKLDVRYKTFFIFFLFYFCILQNQAYKQDILQVQTKTTTTAKKKKKREIQCYNIWIEVHLDIEGVNKRLDF